MGDVVMIASTVAALLSSILALAPDVPLQRPGAPPPAEPVETRPAVDAPAPDTPAEIPIDAPIATPSEPVAAQPEPTVSPEPSSAASDRDLDIAQEYAAASDELERRDRELRRAQSMIAIGAVAGTGGLLLLIGAVTEARKPECKFGLDTCANAPRPALARGLGIGAGIALAGGATLIGLGWHRRHRLRTRIDADATSVAVSLHGRF